MSRLITTDEQLRCHLPNIIASVKGETPLIDKLALFLDLAEGWVVSTFTSSQTFSVICGYTDTNEIRVLTARLVVAEAMLRAIPSLDIVLTPNGFGVVSTNNLAPASKPRVDRLVGLMLTHRDQCIAALLLHLHGASKWLASDQAAFFGATLFPDLGIVDAIGTSGSKWEKYLELRPQIVDLELSLAEEWFSPELMAHLREQTLRHSLSDCDRLVAYGITAQIVAYLKGGTFNSRRLTDIVNHIRVNPTDYPLWHSSETAKLFSPVKFINKKSASGYFF